MDIKPTTPITSEILNAIETQWIGRIKCQQKAIKSTRYHREELEFFCGAMVALTTINPDLILPPRWILAMMRGDRIIDVKRFDEVITVE